MVDVNGILNVVSNIIWVIVGLAVTGAIVWWAMVYRKYNRIVTIHDLTGQSSMIRERKAREIMDDKNVLCWYIKGEKITVPCPPKEAVSIRKGKKYALLVRVRGDQYHWVDVTAFTSRAEDPNGGLGKFFVIAEDAKRQLADQIKKSEQEKQTKFNDLMNKVMPIVVIGILLIGAYFMYDSIGGHMTAMSEQFSGVTSQLSQVSAAQADLLEETKAILNEKYGSNVSRSVTTPPRVPN